MPWQVIVPPTAGAAVVSTPPVNVIVPPLCPKVKYPVLWNATNVVIVPPVPVRLTAATVFGTVNVPALTAPVKLAVPPIVCSASVPVPVKLVPVTFANVPVCNVRVYVLPVTAPIVITPAALVACVFNVVVDPKVIAPKVSAVFDVWIVP
jgi:hypothetical protein